MSARYSWTLEEFRSLAANKESLGYPPDLDTWPDDDRRRCFEDCARLRDIVIGESDALLGPDRLAEGPDDFGIDDWCSQLAVAARRRLILCESPIGQFILRNKLRQELYDSALYYGALGRFFLALKCRRVDIHDAPARGSGGEVPPEKVARMQKELLRLEAPLRAYDGFAGLRQLAIFERHIAPEAEPAVIKPLYVLAGMTGHLGSCGRQNDSIWFSSGADGLGVSARHARP